MRYPLLAIALMASAAQAAPYTMYSNAPRAGQPIRWTINRTDASAAAWLTLTTKSNTATVGTDVQAANIQVNFAPQQVSATVLVPTYVNASKSGQTLKVGLVLSIAGGAQLASSLASIVEPVVTPPPPPPPPPPPTTGWVSAPLVDGGFARCKTVGGCHSWTAPCPTGTETFPPTCTQPNIIAQQGDVRAYAWNGCSAGNPCRYIGAFWPQGQYKVANVGYEGWIDEWEGVRPAS